MARSSVIKGSGSLIAARVGGMAGSFALFVLLTWHSREAAGVFRTAVTYLIIMESLPLLGMHRWLATEISRHAEEGQAMFRMACAFALVIALAAAAIYLGIAFSGRYGPDISACLKVVALGNLPSALNLCIASGFVGLGCTHQSGILAFMETATRSAVSILLVLAGANIVWIMVVFVVVRWILAAIGLRMIEAQFGKIRTPVSRAVVNSFFLQLPNLALSMIGFLALRNAAMLLLPLFRSESEAGLYAAPFQVFDLLLLAPTVLTISTNYAFVTSARHSMSALRRNTHELLSITACYIFPLVTMACVLAQPIIELLFGAAYAGSVGPLRLLLLCAATLSIDQVFSLAMVTAGDYRSDRLAIVFGGLLTIIATCLLSPPDGAEGAAAGFLAGAVCTLGSRLYLMRRLLNYRSLLGAMQVQALAAAAAGAAVWLTAWSIGSVGHAMLLLELLLAPAGAVLYVAVFYFGGGLSARRISRVRHFMTRPG